MGFDLSKENVDKFKMSDLQEKFIINRDKIAVLKAEEKVIKSQQDLLEQVMGAKMTHDGTKNQATDSGSCFFKMSEFVRVEDWDEFFKYIKENEKWELLNRSASKAEVLEFMGDKRTKQPPPGVGYTSITAVQVRRK